MAHCRGKRLGSDVPSGITKIPHGIRDYDADVELLKAKIAAFTKEWREYCLIHGNKFKC